MDYTKTTRLDGKTALITGGARGLGAEIAAAFLQAGAQVMITDVLVDLGEQTQAALAQHHAGKIDFLRHDVTNEAEWEAAVAATVRQYGGLDILVNNAGIESFSFFADCELAEFQRTMTVNVDGVFLGLKHGIRAMRPGGIAGQGGAIVNLSSIAGLIGTPGGGAYCASKGAVRLMTKAAGVECGQLGYGIRVNSVHPGLVKTEMGVNVVSSLVKLGLAPDIATADAYAAAQHPLGYGQPGDIASAVLFLASDAARWMTGAELVADGGLTAH